MRKHISRIAIYKGDRIEDLPEDTPGLFMPAFRYCSRKYILIWIQIKLKLKTRIIEAVEG